MNDLKDQAEMVHKGANDTLDCLFSMYHFALEYRNNVLNLPQPIGLYYYDEESKYKKQFMNTLKSKGINTIINNIKNCLPPKKE